MSDIIQTFVLAGLILLQGAMQGILILLLFKDMLRFDTFKRYYIPFAAVTIYSCFVGVNTDILSIYLIIILLFSIFSALKHNYCSFFTAAFYAIAMISVLSSTSNLVVNAFFKGIYGSIEYYIYLRILNNLLYISANSLIYFYKLKLELPEYMSIGRIAELVCNYILTFLLIDSIIFMKSSWSFLSVYTPKYIMLHLPLISLLLLHNIAKAVQLDSIKRIIRSQQLHICTLNTTLDGLKGFRHDYNNTIQLIGGYLALNNVAGLRKYFSQIEQDVRNVNNVIPLNTFIKDIPALYSLLIAKLNYSDSKNYNFIIDVQSKIELGYIRELDFCKVMGILLDNAFEAALSSEKKLVRLFIKRHDENNKMIIEISNTFSGAIDIKRLFDEGYTTKNDHTGFGLWEIRKILIKYSCFSIFPSVREDIFTQKLEISF